MRSWIMAVFASLLLFAAGVRAEEEPKPPESAERMVFGVVHCGSVYTAENTRAFAKGDFVDGGATATRMEVLGAEPWVDFPPRWKIGGGELAVIHAEYKQIAPVGIRQREIYLTICDLDKLPEKDFHKQPGGSKYDLLCRFSIFGGAGNDSDALIGWVYEAMRDYVNYKYHVSDETHPFSDYEFFYDLVPVKPHSWDHFVLASEALQLHIDDSYRTSAREPTPEGAKKSPRGADRPYWGSAKSPLKPMMGLWHYDERRQWALVDQIKDPPFNERFHAFVKGSTYFFLTDAGKVYLSKKPDKGERKLESLWDNDRYPIVAALEDADTGKVFLFGKARKGDGLGKDFYWELDETVRRHDYDPSAVKAVDTVEPLKTVMEYARFLADEKQIKLEKK